MTTKTLLDMLESRHIKRRDQPGGVFLREVGRNGSWGSGQRCDALYVGFTSASGRILVGHEVKVSRADWLAELRKTGKADTWADQCHAWYLVVSDPAIVHEGELPHGWGLMAPTGGRLKVVTKAQVYGDRTPSWDTMRSIMARLDTVARQQAAEARHKALVEAREAARAEHERLAQQQQQLTPEQRRDLAFLGAIRERCTALGFDLDGSWSDPNSVDERGLAAALNIVTSQRWGDLRFLGRSLRQIEQLGQHAAELASAIDQHTEALVGAP